MLTFTYLGRDSKPSLYVGRAGKLQLKKDSQRPASAGWLTVQCYKCSRVYDMGKAEWQDGSPICPHCGANGVDFL